ncbi:glycogen debranching protein GlgX [Nakamurella sp. PAMC28650]|uniref:glycogen debranching protein GlgX n=1 Tax=Nakamurella sp. PAMC28650 TaxID=2762325 RepID=UPI00164DA788|nr:glycogen debranching protein GlgX [Nakamurella sp. PAMC28650]QNK79742.1 glycogen debranching protein GlgX [Nakamurella sp. PAMC28650]
MSTVSSASPAPRGGGPDRKSRVPTPVPAGSSPFPGDPFPLGATLTDRGTNFAVVADDADSVELCLVDALGNEQPILLQDRRYGIWHTFVPGVRAGQRYGYRVNGRDRSKILLDPYALRVDTTDYDLMAASAVGVDTLGKVPLGIVVEPVRVRGERPGVPWEHTVIYEAHVAGLTRLHPELPAALRGTYAGIAHPVIVDHLRRLKVTTLQLLPVHAHTAEPGLAATGRRNYWGYSTLSFFAVHPGYASVPGQELTEFAAMVDTLHAAGIEVVLDVVYNHTCEGGSDLPVELSWRGLAPDTYYLPSGHDITGTGLTLDPRTLTVVRMITDSLRYWATHLGVDGFRFDLASVLGRPGGGAFDAGSAVLTAIAADPVLSRCKLIAEPWDATGEGYAVGRFGTQWAEWNDRFRDSIRDFWRGVGGVRELGYRLSGSEDLYGGTRGPWASVNFVTAHDGFTLRDVVSYDGKHNEANGERNRDGTDNNRSSNYGAEGPTADPAILATRARQARNIAATMLLSTGTPMLLGGDEMWRTQQGNNNAYCQDNAISWVDWSSVTNRDDDDRNTAAARMLEFVRRTASVRAEAPALHQGEFFEGRAPVGGDGVPDLVWFNQSGERMTDADWFDGDRRTLQMWVDGRDVRGHSPDGGALTDHSWLLVLHSDAQDIEITLPGAPYGEAYSPVLDTAAPTGGPADPSPLSAGVEMTMPGRTLWLLRAHRTSEA